MLRTRTAFQLTLHGERYCPAARIDVEDNGPLFLPIYRIRCSTRWSAVAKAAPLAIYRPQSYRSTRWQINLPVAGHTEFYLPADSEIEVFMQRGIVWGRR